MALITCPECGRRISGKAESCIGCGLSVALFNKVRLEKLLGDKTIKCIVCGAEFNLNEGCCPNCKYPALQLSGEPPYMETVDVSEETIDVSEEPAVISDITTEPVRVKEDDQKSDSNDGPALVSKGEKKSIGKSALLIAVGLVLVCAITAVITVTNRKPSDEEVTAAFESYIADKATHADHFSYGGGGYPAYENVDVIVDYKDYYENSIGTDPVTQNTEECWHYYAIDDFDGDDQLEMVVYNEYLYDSIFRPSLCMYEYSKGDVVKERDNMISISPNLYPEHKVSFYQNGTVIATCNNSEDNTTYKVGFLDDRFINKYGGLRDGEILEYFCYSDDEQYYRALSCSRKSKEEEISRETVENELADFKKDKDGKSLEPMSVQFKKVRIKPVIPTSDNTEEKRMLSEIGEFDWIYLYNYAIYDFDCDYKDDILMTGKADPDRWASAICYDFESGITYRRVGYCDSPIEFSKLSYYDNGMAKGELEQDGKTYTYWMELCYNKTASELGLSTENKYLCYIQDGSHHITRQLIDTLGSGTDIEEERIISQKEFEDEVAKLIGDGLIIEPDFKDIEYELVTGETLSF